MNFMEHKATVVNDLGALLIAIRNEEPIIDVDIQMSDELKEQAQKEFDSSFFSGAMRGFGAVSVVTTAVVISNTITATLAAFGSMTAVMFSDVMKTELSKYSLIVFEHNEQTCILLLHTDKFSRKTDSISGYLEYRIPYKCFGHSVCPKCKKGIDDSLKYAKKNIVNPFYCPHCSQQLLADTSFYSFVQRFTKNELSEGDIKTKKLLHDRELKKMGIDPDSKVSLTSEKIHDFSMWYDLDIATQQPSHQDVTEYRLRLKCNEFTAEPYFLHADGDIYGLTRELYTAPFGTPDANKAVLQLVGYYNILGRQIADAPMDFKERKGMNLIQESFHNNQPVKWKSGKYQNVLKEAAWGAVHGYLYGIPLDLTAYLHLTPTDRDRVELWKQWNEYIKSMEDVPDSVKALFTGLSKEDLKITQIVKMAIDKCEKFKNKANHGKYLFKE